MKPETTADPIRVQYGERAGIMNVAVKVDTVYIVDDDRGFRESLTALLIGAGYRVRSFDSTKRFLAEHDPTTPGCLLLEVCMPGMGGLELQRLLMNSRCPRPIVFLSSTGEICICAQAMKNGAVDFMMKPIDGGRLLEAVGQALQRDSGERRQRAVRSIIRERYARLTKRERQVMEHVVSGRLNKQIAGVLGVGEKTVKVHRGRVMRKMAVDSLPELIQVSARMGLINDVGP